MTYAVELQAIRANEEKVPERAVRYIQGLVRSQQQRRRKRAAQAINAAARTRALTQALAIQTQARQLLSAQLNIDDTPRAHTPPPPRDTKVEAGAMEAGTLAGSPIPTRVLAGLSEEVEPLEANALLYRQNSSLPGTLFSHSLDLVPLVGPHSKEI